MERVRLCTICNIKINHLRCDAKTCSPSCRGRLFRANKANYTLINFKVPNDTYTDLAITAFQARKGISEYLTELVIKHG